MAKKKTKNYKFTNEVLGVVLIGLGFFFGVAAYLGGNSAPAMAALKKFVFGVFGIFGYALPVLCVAGGILLIIERYKRPKPLKICFGIAAFLTLLAFIHVCNNGAFNISAGFLGYVSEAYNVSPAAGGGAIGALLAYPASSYLGNVGGAIILMTAFIVCMIIATGFSIKRCVESIGDMISGRTQESAEQDEGEQLRQKSSPIAKRLNSGEARRKIEKGRRSVYNQSFNYKEAGRQMNEIYLDVDGEEEEPVEEPQEEQFVQPEPVEANGTVFDNMQVDNSDVMPEASIKSSDFDAIIRRRGLSGEDLMIKDYDEPKQTEKPANIEPEEMRQETVSVHNIGEDIAPVDGYSEPQTTTEPAAPMPASEWVERQRAAMPKQKAHREYVKPPITLLNKSKPSVSSENARAKIREHASQLEMTLDSFNIPAKVTNASIGPSVVRFEVQPAPGVNVNKIVNLQKNLAMALAADSIRIEAPIPGKAAVGIEVSRSKEERELVTARDLIATDEFKRQKSILAFAVGKDIAGKKIYADLAKMPHLLISGTTGSGKSVCTNMILTSMLFRATPDEIRFIIVDPKIVEFSVYNGIPHLMLPVVTDPKKAANALNWGVKEMLERYKAFAAKGVKEIERYNELAKQDGEKPLPKLVILIDELADLMMASKSEVEDAICRIAQLGRAAGVHLIVATQRPSVNVVTGLIKANMPSRIALKASSQIDSRTMIDRSGAEKLMGNGDMLFYPAGAAMPVRVQGCFLNPDEETPRIVDFLAEQGPADYDETIIEDKPQTQETETETGEGGEEEVDNTVRNAIRLALDYDFISTSMLQRRMKLGYPRAARVIDEMADMGVIGEPEGSKGRPVLITRERYNEMFGDGGNSY